MTNDNVITLPRDPKSIEYDRITKDFRAELDGVHVGYFRSYHEAERALNSRMFEELYRAQPKAA